MDDVVFDNLDGWRDAQRRALDDSTRRIDWFDSVFADTVAAVAATADRISSLLASSPLVRIHLLVHNDTYFWRHCHRLGGLLTTYGHAFELRLTDEVDRRISEAFLIGDHGVVRRFHAEAQRGDESCDGRVVHLCRQQFQAMWQRSHPPQEGRRLGI